MRDTDTRATGATAPQVRSTRGPRRAAAFGRRASAQGTAPTGAARSTDETTGTTSVAIEPPGFGRTLADRFDPRSNSLDVLRLILATTVAVVHASAIGYGHQPQLGHTEVGALAVDGFFVLSGFLVTRSLLRLNSVPRYAWHRFLRLMPGFWTCLVVTALVVAPVIAWLEGADPRSAIFAAPSSLTFVTDNAALLMRDFSVGGLPQGTHQPGVVNGALWTLFYEAVCYVGVAALGVVGLLRRRRGLVVALTAALGLLTLVQELTPLTLPGSTAPLMLRFAFIFLLGTLAYLYADRVVISPRWLLLAGIVLAASLWAFEDYRGLGGVAFAYVCLYAVVGTPWLRHRPRADLSYGMYVYHWPIETMLVLAGATALTQVGYTALAVLLAAGAAALSWRFVERPALAQKDAFRR